MEKTFRETGFSDVLYHFDEPMLPQGDEIFSGELFFLTKKIVFNSLKRTLYV
jgi:hypothetical protein